MLNAFLWPVFDWFSKNRWAQYLLAFVTGFIVIWMFVAWRENEAVKRYKTKQRVRVVEEQARVIETRRKLEEANHEAQDAAEQAAGDLPDYDGIEQLRRERPDLYSKIFGPAGAGGPVPEGR